MICLSKLLLTSKWVINTVVLFSMIWLPVKGFSQVNDNQPVFNHAALCARNLKKTAAFYSAVMELKTISNPFKDTVHVWFKIGEGLALHVIQGDCPANTNSIGIHLCFSVPSLQAFIKHLDSMKIGYANWAKESQKIQVRTDGVKQIYLEDPDGFWIEVNDAR